MISKSAVLTGLKKCLLFCCAKAWVISFLALWIMQPALAQTEKGIQFSLMAGSQAISSESENLYGESVSQFDRAMQVAFAEVFYQKNEQVALWVRYTNGFNPGPYVFNALNRSNTSLFVGGEARSRAYTGVVQYGYQAVDDSLYRDVLWTRHRLGLTERLTTTLSTWLGVGNHIAREWMIRGGVIYHITNQVGVEPMMLLFDDGLEPGIQRYLGFNLHLNFLEAGVFSIGVSKGGERRFEDTAFLVDGKLPFLRGHQLNLSLQRSLNNASAATLIALGITLNLPSLQ